MDIVQEYQQLQEKAESLRIQKAKTEGELTQLVAQLASFGIENPESVPEFLENMEKEIADLETTLHRRLEHIKKKLEN